jgi:hypothetical protein
MITKDNRGGKRQGAGRPKVKDKKVQIFISVKQSVIKKKGGLTKLKKQIYENLTN